MSTWPLIATKHLELRKRRGLMVTVALLTVAPTVLILGLRLIFHAVDPASYGRAGTPSVFQGLSNLIAEFGLLIAAALGAAAGTTDLTEGVFRNLVITGRSRLALYLTRIPAGLAILLPLVAAAFTVLCLVTCNWPAPRNLRRSTWTASPSWSISTRPGCAELAPAASATSRKRTPLGSPGPLRSQRGSERGSDPLGD